MYLWPVQLFYSEHIDGKEILLDADESRHATQVLRKRIGDEVLVMDGKGSLYTTRITEIKKKETRLDVLSKQEFPPSQAKIRLVVAPTKNNDRIEWLLEKSIEIGLAGIQFVRCDRSERKQVNLERLQKIAVAACKQSLSWHFPEIGDIIPFKDYLNQKQQGSCLIGVCENAEIHLKPGIQLEEEVHILIGPEGDFTPEEYELAKKAGWKGISFGEKRLRTETAALLAVANLNFLHS